MKLCTYWLAAVDIFDLLMLTSRRSWSLMCCNRSSSAILLGWEEGVKMGQKRKERGEVRRSRVKRCTRRSEKGKRKKGEVGRNKRGGGKPAKGQSYTLPTHVFRAHASDAMNLASRLYRV